MITIQLRYHNLSSVYRWFADPLELDNYAPVGVGRTRSEALAALLAALVKDGHPIHALRLKMDDISRKAAEVEDEKLLG